MNEPASDTNPGTATGDISGVEPGEADLGSLLEQVDEAHHSDRLIEMVSNGQTDVKREYYQGQEQAQDLALELPCC